MNRIIAQILIGGKLKRWTRLFIIRVDNPFFKLTSLGQSSRCHQETIGGPSTGQSASKRSCDDAVVALLARRGHGGRNARVLPLACCCFMEWRVD